MHEGFFRVFLQGFPLSCHLHPKSHVSTPNAMESLTENFANCFSTRPAEAEEIPVDEDPVINTSQEGLRNLVGLVVSQKIFSGHSLKMNINHLIHPVRGFAFQDLGDNTVVPRFKHKLDCTLALEGSPWLIDRCALVLAPLEDRIDPGSVVVNLMQIIVRVHHLPLHIAWLLVLGMM